MRPITRSKPSATRLRPEIQALRAVAVMLVVLYHFWPYALRGGYVGVDIFFVISGFLITGQLRRMQQRAGRVRPLTFWAGRLRRLVPAALLVVAATAAGIIAWVPQSSWPNFLNQGLAASLYFVNWALAADSVDYLHSGSVASPFQHYWSLSVEEQFYLVWPLLFLLAAGLIWWWHRQHALSAKHSDTLLIWVLGAVTAASLAWSIIDTRLDPTVAYFSTFTRAWEFAVGGLLTFVPGLSAEASRRSQQLHAAGRWVGLLIILFTAVRFTADLAFPSYTAALPVLGALLVIWGGMPRTWWALNPVVRFRPVQRLGDWSYSLYLWHWPVAILAAYALGRTPGSETTSSCWSAASPWPGLPSASSKTRCAIGDPSPMDG